MHEQALCIASSLAEQGVFGPADVADRFVAWFNSGPFDVGQMTAKALRGLDRGAFCEEAGQFGEQR
ncbi:ADP-ribosylglycohydrolase family protein [Natrinema pallidum]